MLPAGRPAAYIRRVAGYPGRSKHARGSSSKEGMTLPPHTTDPYPPLSGPLATALIALAGTPDHLPGIDRQLVSIAKMTAERVAAARYASITALRGKAYITVAVSDDLVRSIDEAQYADDAGPCLNALRRGAPVGVPDIDTTVQWPGFHQAAPQMGLRASVSVPLFGGRGDALAVLNVYSHDQVAMAPLIAGICSVHGGPGRNSTEEADLSELDDGGRELVAGYAASLDVRATVQLAIELIRSANRCTNEDAYLSLCIQAQEAGTDLAEAAAAIIKNA
jgi:hypothetical protein